jgi:cobalt/nickel transport system permease protein
MAHIHLEDGAFSPEWVIIWSLLAAGLVSLAVYALSKNKVPPRKLAIAAMCTSIGFAVFQISIPIFGGIHLNLTPLIGILAGPALGTLSVLAINVFSAAVGHGGWGMIGPNTIVTVAEVFIAFHAYRLMRTRLTSDRFTSGLGASVLALTTSAFLIVLIIVISGLQDSDQTKAEILTNMLPIAAINMAVGVIEGFVTGYMVSYIGRIRPDLLGEAEGKLKEAGEEPSKERNPAATKASVYAVVLIALGLGLAALVITGNMGIEDRYHNATGGDTGSGDGGGWFGFSIEADVIPYAIAVSVLVLASIIGLTILRERGEAS